jgi:hypothetical protein
VSDVCPKSVRNEGENESKRVVRVMAPCARRLWTCVHPVRPGLPPYSRFETSPFGRSGTSPLGTLQGLRIPGYPRERGRMVLKSGYGVKGRGSFAPAEGDAEATASQGAQPPSMRAPAVSERASLRLGGTRRRPRGLHSGERTPRQPDRSRSPGTPPASSAGGVFVWSLPERIPIPFLSRYCPNSLLLKAAFMAFTPSMLFMNSLIRDYSSGGLRKRKNPSQVPCFQGIW